MRLKHRITYYCIQTCTEKTCLEIVSTRTILLNYYNSKGNLNTHLYKNNIDSVQKISCMTKKSEYVFTSLFAECPLPSRVATKLADTIQSVAALAVLATSFGAIDTISTGLTL